MKPYRTILADDHGLILEGLRGVLAEEPDILVIATATDGERLIETVQHYKPDVVITDIYRPIMNGFECLAEIRKVCPETPVLLLTAYADDQTLQTALKGALMDVHLMIAAPERYLADFAAAGADILTVHVEASPHLHRTVQAIRELGVKAGVTLNPATPPETTVEILPLVDLVLIKSLNPSFGGQRYIPGSTGKIRGLRRMQDDNDSTANLEVNVGIKSSNLKVVRIAGANDFVARSKIFKMDHSVSESMAAFRDALGRWD